MIYNSKDFGLLFSPLIFAVRAYNVNYYGTDILCNGGSRCTHIIIIFVEKKKAWRTACLHANVSLPAGRQAHPSDRGGEHKAASSSRFTRLAGPAQPPSAGGGRRHTPVEAAADAAGFSAH